ncbi:uncharacterized protein BJ171DRAFT_229904 [Polychytrium aggregatum]|uniref:uncharacterized protein n=1 Tax=Polychytrium aggregatum TaxID=110093 RepID=UPI0022FEBACF|nr:uncharacterized protein BJ171DRAFT_229904 [Polychytrium aggregatum]KAI9197236.1 hypothetical protein BJ171DRAFT_229904 [Polychytrium aggregatum]
MSESDQRVIRQQTFHRLETRFCLVGCRHSGLGVDRIPPRLRNCMQVLLSMKLHRQKSALVAGLKSEKVSGDIQASAWTSRCDMDPHFRADSHFCIHCSRSPGILCFSRVSHCFTVQFIFARAPFLIAIARNAVVLSVASNTSLSSECECGLDCC